MSSCSRLDEAEDEKTTYEEPENCSEVTRWPLIIFVAIIFIILIYIIFSVRHDGGSRAWTFFVILVLAIIWGIVIWFFCKGGQYAISWFMLLLPIVLIFTWAISWSIASATAPEYCVIRVPGSQNQYNL